MRIAVVTDDIRIADPLIDAFTAHGHRATRSGRSDELFSMIHYLDAVILDSKLQDLPGIHVLQRLREFSDVPVIMLTPKGDEHGIIRSLHSGADDCVTKPARPAELMARLAAIIRRWMTPLSVEPVVITGDVRIDLAARSIDVAGKPVGLTRTEFDIAATLAESSGTAVSREHLTDRVWGDPAGPASRPLDVHVAALRAKLNRPGLITTVRGFGYRWGLETIEAVAAE
ncbi:response regulator transcription factor [Nocardia sp. GAS34]|uniref:response regulator transcription factor n=1 Tax=unclassified Nocardia TaxID=2637762 RepID=UPI003D192885